MCSVFMGQVPEIKWMMMMVTVCAQSARRLHEHMRVVEHATVELLGQ